MQGKILVAHASKGGSTAEAADTIGQVLNAKGGSVDVRPVNTVTDVNAYGNPKSVVSLRGVRDEAIPARLLRKASPCQAHFLRTYSLAWDRQGAEQWL